MTPRELASQFLLRALEESSVSVSQLKKSGVNLRTVYEVIEGKNVKHSCRFDTLVLLLDACGFELKMEKKR